MLKNFITTYKLNYILSLCFLFTCTLAMGQLPYVSNGKIERLALTSKYIPSRPVDVWLPDNYDADTKYNVLYMQDGQMLFDSTITWNHQEWHIEETIQRLINGKNIPPTIVVAIHNIAKLRYAEYVPKNIVLPSNLVHLFTEKLNDTTDANKYLKFITKELKPYIDQHYSTKSDALHTFIAGSSMGGLMSMYAMCEYPKVFGGAICMSTHWPGGDPTNIKLANAMFHGFKTYLEDHLSKLKSNKFYFDYGSATLDSFYAPYQKQIDRLFKKENNRNIAYLSRYFERDAHDEKAWSMRFLIPCCWMMQAEE